MQMIAFSRRWALLAGLLAVLAPGGVCDPLEADAAATGELDSLLAEVRSAQQAQDSARLGAAYAKLATLQPDNPEFHRGHGLALYLRGEYQHAVAALESAAKLRPDLLGVQLYLAMSLYRTNRFQEALGALENSPELAAGRPVALYWKGAVHRALGQFAPAIAALQTARRAAPPDANLLQLLTRTYSDRSTELLRELLSIAPTSAAARLLRAEELAMDGVEEAALRELESALASSPDFAGLHHAKGEILWSRGEYEAGAAEFRQELENDPLGFESSLRLAAYRLDRGDHAEALALLDGVADYRPNDDRVVSLLASAERLGGSAAQVDIDSPAPPSESLAGAESAYRRGRPDLAVQLLKPFIESEPGVVQARMLLARCYVAQGADSKAANQLTAVLDSDPRNTEALYLAGSAYERLAAATAEDLFALNPDSASVRLLRGEAFERGPKSDLEKALAEFRKAVELQSENTAAHHALGRVLFKMKRYEEAIPHLQEVLARNRRHSMANYLLGKIYLVNRDRITAIKHLEMAIDARPGLSEAKRDLARALVFSGRRDEGIAIYKKLLLADASDPSLHAQLAVAYRTAGRMDEARTHAERAQKLAAAKHQPNRQ